MTSVDRMERLVNLLVALLDTPRPLTREQLRQRVGGYSDDKDNFHRNFERDKDLLRQMGIPVVAEPLDTGTDEPAVGYRVPPDLYELPDPGLDEDELIALNLAVSAVALEGSQASTTALWKLAAASGHSPAGTPPGAPGAGATSPGPPERLGPPEPGHIPTGALASPSTTAPLADVPADDRVVALFSGVAERRVARFGYNGARRQVDPWRLSYRRGRWYLAGFDHDREAERLFRVDRMTGKVELQGPPAAFERPGAVAAGPPPPWRLGDDEEVVVDLRVDDSHLPWVLAMAGEEAVTEGGYVRLQVTNREALRGFVLGLLDHAEVIGPPEVRDEVVSWLLALAGRAEAPAGNR